MATSENLLSATKNKEPMDEIDGNPEDDKVVEVGGPDLDTGAYANFKFDAVAGVKVDTTFPDPVVGAEKAEKGPDEEVTKAIANLPESAESDDEDEDLLIGESDGTEDDDVVFEETDEETDEESDDDDIEVDLADLVDDDTELVDLGPGDGEDVVDDDEDMASESEDDMEEAVDYEEDEMAEGESWDQPSDIDEMYQDMEEEFPVFEMEHEPTEKKLDEADEHPEGCRCEDCKSAPVQEAKDEDSVDSMDAEVKKPVAESKFRVSFKFDDSKTLFENNTTLTEDEKRQSRALFEAAVREAAQSIGTQLQEAYAKRYVKHKQLHEQKTAKLIDQYLSYVVEQWVKDNAVPLRGHIHAKLTENFIAGLKSVFEQNYIDVPTSKVNVVESLAKKVKKLSGELNTAQKETVRLHTEMKDSVARERKALIKEHKARLIVEASAALPSSERGKFAKRAELMPFGASSKEFKKNLVALREQYVRAKRSVERPINVPDAAPLFESKTPTPKAPTAVDAYVRAAGKLTR